MDIIQEAREYIKKWRFLESEGNAINLMSRLVDRLEWKDISSAPKDGALIDLWVKVTNNDLAGSISYHRYTDMHWNGQSWKQKCGIALNQCLGKVEATHWMPLPLPPVGDK